LKGKNKKMKIQRNKKSKMTKMLIIVGCSVLVLLVAAFTYVYAFNGNILGWKAVNNKPATTEQQQAGAKTKSSSNSDTTPAPTTIPGSDKKNVQVAITAANQNGPTLQIRTLISTVDNTGTCTVALTSSGKATVTKTAGVQALASTSTCQGFDIPVSELSNGTWSILVQYSSTSLTGSVTQDVVIK
jgi:flagellar basal body-associated protein FliL